MFFKKQNNNGQSEQKFRCCKCGSEYKVTNLLRVDSEGDTHAFTLKEVQDYSADPDWMRNCICIDCYERIPYNELQELI